MKLRREQLQDLRSRFKNRPDEELINALIDFAIMAELRLEAAEKVIKPFARLCATDTIALGEDAKPLVVVGPEQKMILMEAGDFRRAKQWMESK